MEPAEGARIRLDAGDAEGACSRGYYAMHHAALTVARSYLVNMEPQRPREDVRFVAHSTRRGAPLADV